ncbi:MAG: TRAP transporter small permease [Clostridiales bacterium]|nr:TRAP transporter small permease [Clostridiales bacterium]
MKHFRKLVGKDYALFFGSIFLSITTLIVMMNVFTRYFLNFTFHWAEEIAVGAFVWVIFLGFASAFKTNALIGVEVLVKLLPPKGRYILEMVTHTITAILSAIMLYFSYRYVSSSTKITAALEVSYKYIYVAIIIAFTLITFYAIRFIVQHIQKLFFKKDVNGRETD